MTFLLAEADDRPALRSAMELCDLTGAKLCIAKLDRLSRSVHFLSGLVERGVDFVALDMPDGTRPTSHTRSVCLKTARTSSSTT
ncbi:recombinase family protein [Phenylobacterium sp.]|uniref:recombinase family protein n=1 Tax=Phenylobacterium sp. TaxID=1871053 RepID=UPI003784A886